MSISTWSATVGQGETDEPVNNHQLRKQADDIQRRIVESLEATSTRPSLTTLTPRTLQSLQASSRVLTICVSGIHSICKVPTGAGRFGIRGADCF